MSKRRLLLIFFALSCLMNNVINAIITSKEPEIFKASKTDSNNSASNINKLDENKTAVENRQNKVSDFSNSEKLFTKQVLVSSGTLAALGLSIGGIAGYFIGANGKTEMNDQIASLKTELSTKNSKISQLESEIKKLKISKDTDSDVVEAKKLQEEIKTLNDQLSQQKQTILELTVERDNKTKKIESLKASLENVINEKNEAIAKANKVVMGDDKEKNKLINDACEKIKNIQKEKSILTNQLDKVKEENEIKTKELQQLNQKYTLLYSEIKSLKEECAAAKKFPEKLQKVFTKVSKKVNKSLNADDHNYFDDCTWDINKKTDFDELINLIVKGKILDEAMNVEKEEKVVGNGTMYYYMDYKGWDQIQNALENANKPIKFRTGKGNEEDGYKFTMFDYGLGLYDKNQLDKHSSECLTENLKKLCDMSEEKQRYLTSFINFAAYLTNELKRVGLFK